MGFGQGDISSKTIEMELDQRERFLKRILAPRLAAMIGEHGGRLERTDELMVARRDGPWGERFLWVIEFPAKLYLLWKDDNSQWVGCHCITDEEELFTSLDVLGDPLLFALPPKGFTEKGDPVAVPPLYLSREEIERLSGLVRLEEWL